MWPPVRRSNLAHYNGIASWSQSLSRRRKARYEGREEPAFENRHFHLIISMLGPIQNYLDRQNLANAYVSGMKEEIGFTGIQYNLTVTIFLVGYIVGGVPQSLIVASNKIPLSFWLPFCCFCWGMLTLGNVWQIQVLRFCMALFEAVSFAGGHYVIGSWYKPSELAKRAYLLTAAQNSGGMFAGLMQGAIYTTLDGNLGISGWRWLMIINSLMTCPIWIWGFITFPGTPAQCNRWYLSEEEKALAISRLPPHKPTPLDRGVFRKFSFNTNMEWSGLYVPMSLWMKWTGHYTIPEINYHPLGVTAVTIASTCIFALWTDYTRSRWWVNPAMAVCSGIPCIMLLVPSLPVAGKYAAWYLAGMGFIGQAVNFAWANEVCRDDDQLRSVTLYTMVYGSNVTIAWFNIAFFPVTDAPDFMKGYAAALATCVLSPPIAFWIHKRCLRRESDLAEEVRCESSGIEGAVRRDGIRLEGVEVKSVVDDSVTHSKPLKYPKPSSVNGPVLCFAKDGLDSEILEALLRPAPTFLGGPAAARPDPPPVTPPDKGIPVPQEPADQVPLPDPKFQGLRAIRHYFVKGGKYAYEGQEGVGKFGSVYRLRQVGDGGDQETPDAGRRVVAKLVRRFPDNRYSSGTLQDEVQALKTFEGGVDQYGVRQYILMEYLEGGTFRAFEQRVRQRRMALPNRLLWSIFRCFMRIAMAMIYYKDLGDGPVRLETAQPDPHPESVLVNTDMHPDNLMFGTYNPSDESDTEHRLSPCLKMIDLGSVDWVDTSEDKEWERISENIVSLVSNRFDALLQTCDMFSAKPIDTDLTKFVEICTRSGFTRSGRTTFRTKGWTLQGLFRFVQRGCARDAAYYRDKYGATDGSEDDENIQALVRDLLMNADDSGTSGPDEFPGPLVHPDDSDLSL
ncbi:MFS general substrate transporter [Apiospora saccharicola]|uniref:MFS general substrate transporter n=1 Tax=Apiospora saccharicola TaxID=335842 RepID=A0ABR1UHF7_9PEZI